ncbi:hypothetical protein GCM10009540_63490 [Streptomyces turgidiscabies]
MVVIARAAVALLRRRVGRCRRGNGFSFCATAGPWWGPTWGGGPTGWGQSEALHGRRVKGDAGVKEW